MFHRGGSVLSMRGTMFGPNMVVFSMAIKVYFSPILVQHPLHMFGIFLISLLVRCFISLNTPAPIHSKLSTSPQSNIEALSFILPQWQQQGEVLSFFGHSSRKAQFCTVYGAFMSKYYYLCRRPAPSELSLDFCYDLVDHVAFEWTGWSFKANRLTTYYFSV